MQHKAVTIPEEAAELSHRRTLSNSFRIVDLNNKESSFMLLKMMKQEERRRLEKQSSLQKTLLKKTRSDENSLPFCLSSSSGSSFSSASTPQSPTQSLNTSFNSNASYCMMSSSDAFLNATYPPYRRINNSPNFSTETVMSQENLAQYQQQQQHPSNNNNHQLQQQQKQNNQIQYQSTNSGSLISNSNSNSGGASNSNKNVNIFNNTNTNNISNTTSTSNSLNNYNQVASNIERDVINLTNDINQQHNSFVKLTMTHQQQPTHSVTISTQLQSEQLRELQSQAANNLVTQPPDANGNNMQGSSIQSHSSISSNSSTMATGAITGAIPKDYDESGEETEEENEVLEESPEGRWIKRNESVSQRDVPGIDQAFLAMDTEYGIEVVWNEINLLGGKKLRNSQDEAKIDMVFENLISLNHPNIVKFHKYWRDKNKKLPRIIFITEYMSSGSLKQFLRKAKRTNQPIKKSTWKRWCIQLLTALHYLHNSEAPIIHGNLSGETIFIQHNGLIKIGSIAPDIVNAHVKTCIDNSWWTKNRHFMAPELHEIYCLENPATTASSSSSNSGSTSASATSSSQFLSVNTAVTSGALQWVDNQSTPAVDIYSFGMVALEMFNLELGGNGDTHAVTPELINQSIEVLDKKQQDFIKKCLVKDPAKRPNAKDLLFHPLLFEVPSLRLLAAHQIIKIQNECGETNTEIRDENFRRHPDCVIASTNRYYNSNEENKTSIASSSSNSSLKSSKSKSLASSASNSTSSSSNSLASSPTPGQTNSSQQNVQPSEQLERQKSFSNKFVDFKYSLLNQFEANKYLEDVKNGIYPLTAYGLANQGSLIAEAIEDIDTEDAGNLNTDNGTASNTNNSGNNNNVNSNVEASSNEIFPSSLNNNTNDTASYNRIQNSLSPSSRSLSGTNTSLASTNLSSASSSSSTSPSQSLSQVVLPNSNQAIYQQHQQVNQNYETHPCYVPDQVSNLMQTNNMMLNQLIQNSSLLHNNNNNSANNGSYQSHTEQLYDELKSKKLFTNDNDQTEVAFTNQQQQQQYNNSHVSSSNSSTAPTPTPVHHNQQQYFNNNSDSSNAMSKYTSPSTSPPPPHVQSYPNGSNVMTNGNHRSLSKSPIRTVNGQDGISEETGGNVERRHAEKMEYAFERAKLSLNITFDDKTSRFVESFISNTDTANKLTEELIQYGLVSEVDKESLFNTLSIALSTKRDQISESQHQQQLQQLNENSQTFLTK